MDSIGYDDSLHKARTVYLDFECPDCGRAWSAKGIEEYGSVGLDDDDDLCPECGAEGEQR